jgi:hypothetical protein
MAGLTAIHGFGRSLPVGNFFPGDPSRGPLPQTRTVRTLFPVESTEDEPVKFQPEPIEPEAGGRWGKPGNFAFTVADTKPNQDFGMSVTVTPWPDQPVIRYKYLSTTARIFRDSYVYHSSSCDEGSAKERKYSTEFTIARDLSFGFEETRPKPHIYSLTPIRRYNYDLHLLPRGARESEFKDECGNELRSPASKYAMQGNFENETGCTVRVICECAGLQSTEEEVQANCFPVTDTGDPDKCIHSQDTSGGGTFVIKWIVCGCFSIFGAKEDWPPPLPENYLERPCAAVVHGGDDFIDRNAYWGCVCCP